MERRRSQSEYILKRDGTEVCAECGHLSNDYGAGHYHDCRYFALQDELEEEIEEVMDDPVRNHQMTLFRPAA